MLVAKTFLALANKKNALDREKEPWLGQMNDFLRSQSAAYDDYITLVSTEPPSTASVKPPPLGDEDDFQLQKAVSRRLNKLSPLHRESIPVATYMLDRPLALASLVSYVVRAASIRGVLNENEDGNQVGNQKSDDTLADLIDICCDVEDQAGYYIDKAGFDPE